MKILRFAEWVAERVSVKPITNAELDKVKEIVDQVVARNQQAMNYKGKKLRDIGFAFSKYYANFLHTNAYLRGGYTDAYSHTMDTRFKVWANTLSGPALLKKHEQRANSKTIKEPKLFATVYCAFEMYGKENNPTANTIIDYYMNRLKRQYGITDEDIINIFFE